MGAVKSGAAAAAAGLLLSLFLPLTPAAEASVPSLGVPPEGAAASDPALPPTGR